MESSCWAKLNFGQSVRVALIKKGKDFEWLSRELGISKQAIFGALKRNNPNTSTVERYATALELTPIQLLELGI